MRYITLIKVSNSIDNNNQKEYTLRVIDERITMSQLNNNNTKYGLEELLYMLEGDTTVMRGLILENTEMRKHLRNCIDGKISYDELLDLSYEEF